jgi:hypothetical protein
MNLDLGRLNTTQPAGAQQWSRCKSRARELRKGGKYQRLGSKCKTTQTTTMVIHVSGSTLSSSNPFAESALLTDNTTHSVHGTANYIGSVASANMGLGTNAGGYQQKPSYTSAESTYRLPVTNIERAEKVFYLSLSGNGALCDFVCDFPHLMTRFTRDDIVGQSSQTTRYERPRRQRIHEGEPGRFRA